MQQRRGQAYVFLSHTLQGFAFMHLLPLPRDALIAWYAAIYAWGPAEAIDRKRRREGKCLPLKKGGEQKRLALGLR